jgi:hypothetical protein
LPGIDNAIGLAFEERKLCAFVPAIRELRQRCGQQDDLTTDPQYFIAVNTLKGRRVTAVLIRRDHELEACVLFFEYCRFGVGLGLLRGGDAMGEGLVTGPAAFRIEYVHLATQALLQRWRIHGVSFATGASLHRCIEVLGPQDKYRIFSARSVAHKLPLENCYQTLLAGMGPRTRRSLAGKRRSLERSRNVAYLPSLEPTQALEAMLTLQPRSLPKRITAFYHARYHLLCERPEFFCMGMRLSDGTWLTILSGWRRNGTTYIDLQMNDIHFKKESLSAVMRAFMLEHEIGCNQNFIDFVGGTSLLLRRYCRPIEPCTDVLLWRPGLRTTFSRTAISCMKPDSFYERVKTGTENQILQIPRNHL